MPIVGKDEQAGTVPGEHQADNDSAAFKPRVKHTKSYPTLTLPTYEHVSLFTHRAAVRSEHTRSRQTPELPQMQGEGHVLELWYVPQGASIDVVAAWSMRS